MSRLVPRAQERAWERLQAMSDKLPQALLCVGPAGVGKRQAVKALFQLLHCEDGGGLFGGGAAADRPCGRCTQCVMIAEGRHPDYVEIKPSGEQIVVGDLTEMKKMLYFAPMDGTVRFVVIDEAHRLNLTSANSLLKTLEEPPAHTRFFLITHERGMLLPTILSRCQFLHFSPLDPATLEELLTALNIEFAPKIKPLVLDLLGGGLARAEALADEKTSTFLFEAMDAVSAPGRPDWERAVRLAESLGNDETKIELLLDVILWSERARAMSSAGKGDLRASFEAAASGLGSTFLQERLARYANRKLVALAAADLAEERRART